MTPSSRIDLIGKEPLGPVGGGSVAPSRRSAKTPVEPVADSVTVSGENVGLPAVI
jgi:hypothetical protein